MAYTASVGSSPLARGLLDDSAQALALVGIIPARAGFTGVQPGAAGGRWDHPRSRGVYLIAGGRVLGATGSSPLARGLHHRTVLVQPDPRIIPARAGFTGM